MQSGVLQANCKQADRSDQALPTSNCRGGEAARQEGREGGRAAQTLGPSNCCPDTRPKPRILLTHRNHAENEKGLIVTENLQEFIYLFVLTKCRRWWEKGFKGLQAAMSTVTDD